MGNESPVEILLWALGVVAVIVGFFCLLFWSTVESMSGPDFTLQAADPERYRRQFVAAARFNSWAEEHGFEWVGAYVAEVPQQIFAAVWKQLDAPRYFVFYRGLGTQHCEFVTEFDNGSNLCTCSIKDEHAFPVAPGNFLQTFHKTSHEELWEHHRHAEDFLSRNRNLSLFAGELPPYDELVLSETRERLKYVKSLPLWPLRGAWWYLTRGRKTNKSIEDQDRNGTLSP